MAPGKLATLLTLFTPPIFSFIGFRTPKLVSNDLPIYGYLYKQSTPVVFIIHKIFCIVLQTSQKPIKILT